MIRILPFLITFLFAQTTDFDTHFTGSTLRFDYYHSGTATNEHISLDEVRLEGQWPGSRTQLIDNTNMGKYFFEVLDAATGSPIYSRGFASIYGEWETTGEAHDGIWRTLHESMRFPEPKAPVTLILKKRGNDGNFSSIYSGDIDPAGRTINRSKITTQGKVWSLFENGAPAEKVDLLILGDGYTKRQKKKFHKDVERLVGVLFDTEPFKSRKGDFNVWAIDLISTEAGISNPRMKVWKDNPLGTRYNSFDSDRYVLTYANKDLRDIAAQAPYDHIMIFINEEKYGGGGIFNLWATTATDPAPSPYLFVHELGHSFAGLADEYYTSSVAYEGFNEIGVEPWEPNVTALLDPENIKWKHMIEEGTPLPTPWVQTIYDSTSYNFQKIRNDLRSQGASEARMDEYFAEVKAVTRPMLENEPYFGKVGAFEGAAYMGKGMYRSEVDCIMFTRNPTTYCRVCTAGIERIIDLYSK